MNSSKTKLTFITFILLLFAATNIYAADYYVAQYASGSGNGDRCANADALADLTWGPGNMVEAGDTLHLCGTFTSKLTIGASGTSDNPITVKFESGAKFSAPTWGAASGAINISSRDYIIIDGGTNGIIECTDNGTPAGKKYSPSGTLISGGLTHTYSDDTYGVYVYKGGNYEIKNLTIQNIYHRISSSNDNKAKTGKGIMSAGTRSNALIHDNTTSNVYHGMWIYASTGGGSADNIQIYNNTMSGHSVAINMSLEGAVNITNAKIYGNTISGGGKEYGGCWGGAGYECTNSSYWNHVDAIHTYGNYSSNHIGIDIYNNLIHGDFGLQTTASIYLTDYTTPVKIYNNVIDGTNFTGAQSSGLIGLVAYGNNDYKIYNNTLIGTGSTSLKGPGIYLSEKNTGFTPTADIKNNIIYNNYIGIYDNDSLATITSDYNDFYGNGNIGRRGATWYTTLAKWKEVGYDAKSITSNPQLTASYALHLGSPAIDAGTNLSSVFTTDYLGYIRQNPWDIGAYDYAADAAETQYALSVTSANGTVTINPSGMNCESTCSINFSSGVSVILTAKANGGYTFSGWTGACSGTGTCTVIMTAATSVTANFMPVPISKSVIASGDDGGEGGGGCFIATAAYGSYLDSNVMILRDFRDRVLLKNKLGKNFVEFYYKHSPPIANAIIKHDTLRIATRLILTPIVYTLVYPNFTLILLLISFLILFAARRKERPRATT